MGSFGNISRSLAILFVLVMLSPLLLIYFYNLPAASLWAWIWIFLWVWFIYSKQGLVERGLWFIAGTSLIAVFGGFYLKSKGLEDSVVIDTLSQMMLLIAGGVGGNFMAHDLLAKGRK